MPVAAMVLLAAAVGGTSGDDIPLRGWTAPPFWAPQTSGRPVPEAGVSSSAPLPFIAITPCRLADTRGNGFTGAFGPPSLSAGVPRDVPIAGACGIPTGAQAVSANLTVTNTLGSGFLAAYPQGAAYPGVSTLNYRLNQAIANAAVVPLGTAGGVTFLAGGSGADLIVDVNGYYAPESTSGTITGVTAGYGLTGGGTSGVVTLGLAIPLSLLFATDGSPIVSVTSTRSGDAIVGTSTSGAGVHGETSSGDAVYGHTTGTGHAGSFVVENVSTTTPALVVTSDAENANPDGPAADAATFTLTSGHSTGAAVHGFVSTTFGYDTTAAVRGTSTDYHGYGGYFEATSPTGVAPALGAFALGTGTGLVAYSAYGNPLVATTPGSLDGVVGSSNGVGVHGFGSQGARGESTSSSGFGVVGYASATSGFTRGVYGQSDSPGGYGVHGYNGGGGYAIYCAGNGGYTGSWSQVSDARLKRDVATLDRALEKVLALRGVSYRWRRDEFPDRGLTDAPQVGFVAQEVRAVFPQVVVTGPDGYEAVDYAKLTPLLVEAVKTLEARVRALEEALAAARQEAEKAVSPAIRSGPSQ